MIRETPAMTVRQNLGELLSEVQYRGDKVVITKAGKPVAALIDIGLFERIRKLDEEFAAMLGHMQDAFSRMPEAEGQNMLVEAIAATRKSI